MHTKVVINFNKCVFGNCGFLFPIHIREQMTTWNFFFLDLYSITNHVGAKNGPLLEAKNNVLKGFSQKKFTLIYY
jgi:hypothetical protein